VKHAENQIKKESVEQLNLRICSLIQLGHAHSSHVLSSLWQGSHCITTGHCYYYHCLQKQRL